MDGWMHGVGAVRIRFVEIAGRFHLAVAVGCVGEIQTPAGCVTLLLL